jgi:hypothetical protein
MQDEIRKLREEIAELAALDGEAEGGSDGDDGFGDDADASEGSVGPRAARQDVDVFAVAPARPASAFKLARTAGGGRICGPLPPGLLRRTALPAFRRREPPTLQARQHHASGRAGGPRQRPAGRGRHFHAGRDGLAALQPSLLEAKTRARNGARPVPKSFCHVWTVLCCAAVLQQRVAHRS